MTTYLTVHETEESYNKMTFDKYNTPHVAYIIENNVTNFISYIPPSKAGDIVYYVDGNLKTAPYASYNTSMGTAVGVIVVPEGFAPDGKARMVSLKFATSVGTSSDTSVGLKWATTSADTTLTNYNRVPTTDNVGSTTTGSNGFGCLPSDNFSDTGTMPGPPGGLSGVASVIDPEAKYDSTSDMIPSPYINGAANPDYYGAIEGYNNALSDFNGSGNTATLVGLGGSNYAAAFAANNYSDGVSGAKWYLPAMGELGYLVARFKEINNAIAAAGGVALPSNTLWSSTECGSSGNAYYLHTGNGLVNNYSKDNECYVRPFALV